MTSDEEWNTLPSQPLPEDSQFWNPEPKPSDGVWHYFGPGNDLKIGNVRVPANPGFRQGELESDKIESTSNDDHDEKFQDEDEDEDEDDDQDEDEDEDDENVWTVGDDVVGELPKAAGFSRGPPLTPSAPPDTLLPKSLPKSLKSDDFKMPKSPRAAMNEYLEQNYDNNPKNFHPSKFDDAVRGAVKARKQALSLKHATYGRLPAPDPPTPARRQVIIPEKLRKNPVKAFPRPFTLRRKERVRSRSPSGRPFSILEMEFENGRF